MKKYDYTAVMLFQYNNTIITNAWSNDWMILGYPHDKTETSIWDLGIFLQGPGNSVRTKWDSTRHQKIPQLDQMASTMEAGENQRYQRIQKVPKVARQGGLS